MIESLARFLFVLLSILIAILALVLGLILFVAIFIIALILLVPTLVVYVLYRVATYFWTKAEALKEKRPPEFSH